MDDNSFDKIIKKKAESFVDSGQDPQALANMRNRLANLPSTSGNGNWVKPAAIAAAMLLFTLVNFGVVWYFSEGRYEKLDTQVGELKAERSQLVAERGQLLIMQEQLMNLKNNNTIDTVYIFRDVVTTTSGNNSSGANNLNFNGSFTPARSVGSVDPNYPSSKNNYQSLTANEALSEELTAFLSNQGLLLVGEEGHRILVVKGQEVNPISLHNSNSNYMRSGPNLPNTLPRVWDLSELNESTIESKTRKLSNKTLWALEKHQHSGVDFQYGLEVMTTQSLPELGIGDLNASVGLLTEVIFSPSLRLETGVSYGRRSYRVKEQEIMGLSEAEIARFPGFNPLTGDLIQVESESEVVKIPINLKLMGVLDHNKRWYVSAGVSPQWTLEQEFDFQYAIDGPSNPGGDLDEFRSFIGTRQDVGPEFYVGTFNLGIGTEIFLNESTRWQIGAYYERSLNTLGAEDAKMQGIGLKTSIWLNKP